MNTLNTYTIDSELWESGALGQDETHIVRADSMHELELDASLDLQMISIRLQKKLIDDLKVISRAHGIGYQPLIRDILSRFVTHEIKLLMRDALERRKLEAEQLQEEVTKKSRPISKKAA